MTEPRRYHLIDALRAVAIINMILFHLYYDVSLFTGVTDGFTLPPAAAVWEQCIGGSFILLSGISVNFSRHGYRRGVIVALCALGVTAATYLFMRSFTVWFGILHFLACAMLLTHALRHAFDRIQPVVGMAVFFILFALTYNLRNRTLGFFTIELMRLPDALFQYKWLSFIGFLSKDFTSGDYFPLIPFLFLFWFGYYLWKWIAARGWDTAFTRKIPVLDLIGRHSLLIYLVHQPLLYGICWLLFGGVS